MVFAMVPEAPPAWKKCRATSCPAPISAKVPYFRSSRLIVRALRLVVRSSFCGSLMVGGEIEDEAKHEISRKKSAHVHFFGHPDIGPTRRNLAFQIMLARSAPFHWPKGGNTLTSRLNE